MLDLQRLPTEISMHLLHRRPPAHRRDSRSRHPVEPPSRREDDCRSPRPAEARIAPLVALLALLAAPPLASQTLTPTQDLGSERVAMVETQVQGRGVRQPSLLAAMRAVPRHRFVPERLEREAYLDQPVTIAPGHTLSQAYVSARMISLLDLDGDERVLEIGTGSGYDAAVLSRIVDEVYTIEIDDEMASRARRTLRELGYDNVRVRIGDGYRGWPEEAPFDAILMTTAPPRIPEPLFDQLAPGGKMVIAVGYSLHQDLKVITKTLEGDREVRRISLVSLTPMTGEVQGERSRGGG